MDVAQLLATAGMLAPGFIAMKLFYVFGAQRQWSQWEWTAWSVGLSIPLDWATRTIAPVVASRVGWPGEAVDVVIRFLLALGIAGIGIFAWRWLKGSNDDRLVAVRRALTDSAWDEVMDDAVQHQRWLEVMTDGPDREIAFRGWLATAGREDSRAEPWIYLRRVSRQSAADGEPWEEMPATHGLLIHRDHIKRIRVFTAASDEKTPHDQSSTAGTTAAIMHDAGDEVAAPETVA